MSGRKKRVLREKPRISYYEPDEPALDEYVFCEECRDYVFEYCAIHGPLLVIPDDKVSYKPNIPAIVPRAALTIPRIFLHLARSIIPGAGIGVFSTLTLPRGVRFGPYRGQRSLSVDSMYCWQIHDGNSRRSHVVDAADPQRSNWMRYVNCARHWSEQNLVAYQYRGELYYRTIKIIPRFTELFVFYGSEYANILHINLGAFNAPAGYAAKYGAPILKKPKLTILKDKSQNNDTKKLNKSVITKSNIAQNIVKKISTDDRNTYQPLRRNELTASPIKFLGDTCDKLPEDQGEKTLNVKHDAYNYEIVVKSSMSELTEKYYNHNSNRKQHNQTQFEVKLSKPDYGEKCVNKTTCSHITTREAGLKSNTVYCDHCQKCFNQKSRLIRHLRTHSGEKLYKCEQCQKCFSKRGNLITHLISHTGEKSFRCEQCHKCFSERGSLNSHLRAHTGEKPYKCEQCHKCFSQRGSLNIHLRTHTGEKPYKCEQCHKCFSQRGSLNIHLRTHTGEKPYKCEQCHKCFSKRGSLNIHLRTHTGEKLYKCEQCHKCFSQRGSLNIHLRTHTGEKLYKCEQCHKCFSQSSNLNTHLRTHTGLKPFKCGQCHKCFSQSSHLNTHLRTHTGLKPFKCEQCHKYFSQRGSLNTHLRTHTGEKLYKREQCHKYFSQRGELNIHLRTHTGEKPYKCEQCHKCFSQSSHLNTHLRTHTIET